MFQRKQERKVIQHLAKKKTTTSYLRSVRLLQLSYLSAVAIIVVLLLSSQIIIQRILSQQVQTRAAITQLAQSAVLSQQIEQDLLELQIHPAQSAQILQSLHQNAPAWQHLQDGMYAGSLPTEAVEQMRPAQPHYHTMILALNDIFHQEQARHPVVPDQDSQAFFDGEQIFLPELEHAYFLLASEADTQVANVHFIELALCGLSLLTIFAEMALVARPALSNLNAMLKELQTILTRIKGKEEAKEVR